MANANVDLNNEPTYLMKTYQTVYVILNAHTWTPK